jgi:hypothetical protein
MGEWLKDNPIKSQILNLAITILLLLATLFYCKKKYFNVSIDTNERIKNVEKYIVPDSLIYYKNER